MRPFFSYYGAKWTGAKHYGAPRREIVVEPFAGSACYSTRWGARKVRLYDLSVDICDLWDFLIHCSDRDIASIPDTFGVDEDLDKLGRGPRLLVGFWVAKGRAECASGLSPWYHAYKNNADCRVWGPAVKARVLRQKPEIRDWSIDCASWRAIPLEDAHWHIDPPYQGSPGRRYPHSDIDYPSLSEWCQSLPGAVDVCENQGANWLPFSPLYQVVSSRGRRDGSVSKEALWRRDALSPSAFG